MKDSRKIKEIKEQPKMKSPLDFFFKMGDWVTKGDPQKQQDFTYYMLWILFTAFTAMFISNLYLFITTLEISYIIWALIGFAIASLQFFNLKSFWEMRKARKDMKVIKATDEIEDVDVMLKGFKEVKGGKEEE